jgi:hypothetical protein
MSPSRSVLARPLPLNKKPQITFGQIKRTKNKELLFGEALFYAETYSFHDFCRKNTPSHVDIDFLK